MAKRQTAATAPAYDGSLGSRAMLVNLHMPQWGNRKTDKRISRETAQEYGLGEKVGRYNKWLLIEDEDGNRAKEYMAIVTVVNASRQRHYELSLQWGDDGMRIQSAANYMPWLTAMREQREEFEKVVDVFVKVYPKLVQRSQELMGRMKQAGKIKTMFLESDYPQPFTMRDRFAFETRALPLPEADRFNVDFRVSLGDRQAQLLVEATRQQIEADMAETLNGISAKLFERLSKVVARVIKIGEKGGQLRDVLADDLRETCGLVGRLNFTGDPNVEQFKQRVLKELTFDTASLKGAPEARKQYADRASKIMDDMAAFMGTE